MEFFCYAYGRLSKEEYPLYELVLLEEDRAGYPRFLERDSQSAAGIDSALHIWNGVAFLFPAGEFSCLWGMCRNLWGNIRGFRLALGQAL